MPRATHIPFLYDPAVNMLSAHMARANPQWRTLDGQTVLTIFSGPHAYISPSWYEVAESVPTWNYEAVHVYGPCRIIDNDEELADLIQRMVAFYEPHSDLLTQGNAPFFQNMMKAIVGFTIEVTEVHGAAKLSQNKSIVVQERIINNLKQTKDAGAQTIAGLMDQRLKSSPQRDV